MCDDLLNTDVLNQRKQKSYRYNYNSFQEVNLNWNRWARYANLTWKTFSTQLQ